MDERTLRVLELEKVLQHLAERCSTAMGRELALALMPSVDKDEVVLHQRETTEARQRLERFGPPPIRGISDIRQLLERAQQGTLLEPSELLTVARTLERATELKAFLLKPPLQDCLSQQAERISDHSRLIARVRWCIGEDGQILDRASNALAQIRRRIESIRQRTQSKLNDLLRDPAITKVLQEPYYTVRDGRYCLPVKAEFRQAVAGIIHDKSSSGLTLFIEPEPLVELGNELRLSQADEEREVAKILRSLTNEVVSGLLAIAQTLDAIRRIDFAFAKAKLSQDMKAYEPEIIGAKVEAPTQIGMAGNDASTNRTTVGLKGLEGLKGLKQGFIKLRRARHPLLHFQGFVVPIDFELGADFDVLVITGPNTGGKTVTLKTVGLLTLMAQCGLHVPAAEGAKLSVFRQVFADIGDEQSIEQSLSTFSSHITHIAKILQRADENTLALLDEIGAGTDPIEGSALAKAILLFLHRCGAKVVCTTHFGELKHFAYRQPRFHNASVLFDPETLRPTFQLLIGVPGQSHAIDIAKRLGVPSKVVREAKRQLRKDRKEADELMSQLSEERQAVEKLRLEWQQKMHQLEKQEADLHQREEELRKEEKAIFENARRQAEQLIRHLEGQAEEVMKMMRKQGVMPAEVRKRLRELWKQLPSMPNVQSPMTSEAATMFSVGMTVRIRDIGVVGKIVAVGDGGKEVQVDAGGMNIWISASKLEVVSEAKPVTPTTAEVAAMRFHKMVKVPTELNMRGMRVDEVLETLEKFLDDALLAGHKVVRIVHGKGTGKLRQAVHDFLRTHLQVHAFELAPLEQGGDGVTLVYLEAM